MTVILGLLGGPLGRWLGVGLAVLALAGAFGVQAARIRRLEGALAAAHRQAADDAQAMKAWADAAKTSEAARLGDQHAAAAAQTAAGLACDARVAEARRSSAAIRTLIEKEPARDQNGCPRRELVDADGLRDALRAPAP